MTAEAKTDLELAADHRYRLLSGEVAVSVTTISGLMDDGKAMGFAYAATKLAREGLDFRTEWEARGTRGTRIHGHLDSFLRGESIEEAEDEAGYVDAISAFITDHDPEVIESEFVVLSDTYGYGGRGDHILRPRKGEYAGAVILDDLKTGKKHPFEHTLQLSAYRYADGIAVFDDEGALTGQRELPDIDLTMGLYAHDDGTYDLVPYPADAWAHNAFCSLLDAYYWTRSDAMKAADKAARGKKK